MGRFSRIEARCLTYYVCSEGKDGQKIFMDDDDRLYFISLLKQQKIKSNLTFYGYVLLANQYSCLMETYTNNLSKSMHQINSGYANYFNRRHKHKNKLFKDRYSCVIIAKKKYLKDACCYLHLQPKKAGVAKSLFQYNWSSLPGYISKEKREDWIDYDTILSMFNGNNQKVSLNYQKFINESLKKRIVSPFKNVRRTVILGSEDFKKEVLKKHHLSRIAAHRGEEILAKIIIELVNQPSYWSSLRAKNKKFNKTILSRNAAIYFLKKYTDLSNQEICNYFKSLKKSSISQMSRRFNFAKEKNEIIKKSLTA